MEGTNSSGMTFVASALLLARQLWMPIRFNRSPRSRPDKDDGIDAEVTARGFLAGTLKALPNSRADQVEMILKPKVVKESAIDARTKAINQIRSLLITGHPSSARKARWAGPS